MPNITPEFNRSEQLAAETEKAAKAIGEAREQLREAGDFSNEKEKEATQESGVKFDSNRPSEHLVEHAEKTGIRPQQQEVQKTPEAGVSDMTQIFIDRLTDPHITQIERIAIMNEVLAASQTGKISPNEASELLNKTT